MFDLTALLQDPAYIQSQLLFQNKDPSQALALSQAAKQRSQEIQQNQVAIQNQAAGQSALQGSDLTRGLNPDVIAAVMKADPELGLKLQNAYTQQQTVNPFAGIGGAGDAQDPQALYDSAPPQIKAKVDALREGRAAWPTGFQAKDPNVRAALSLAQMLDPELDQTSYGKRQQTVKDFAPGGKYNQNIVKVETALNHLAELKDKSDSLGEDITGTNWGGAIRNTIKGAEGDKSLNDYNLIAKTAADEVSAATAGPGGSTDSDRKNRLGSFNPNNPAETRTSAISDAIGLLNGRLEPLKDAYNEGLKKNVDSISLLSPQAQKSYRKLMGINSDNQRSDTVAAPTANSASGALPPGFTADQIAEYKRIKGIK